MVEDLLKVSLSEWFRLVYGTSTGAIIGSMVALGESVETIWERYQNLAPQVMKRQHAWSWLPRARMDRSAKLRDYATQIYGDAKFDSFKTRVGIVATKLQPHEPMIFKSHRDQLLADSHGFQPGFGSSIANAVVASCSAYPVFDQVKLDLGSFGERNLIDGGHMANNPTLLALVDAVRSIRVPHKRVRVLSVGTGQFPDRRGLLHNTFHRRFADLRRLMTLLDSSTRSMEWLSGVLFQDISTVRINEAHMDDGYRTNFLETDVGRLRELYSAGVEDAHKAMSDLEQLFESAP